MTGKYILHKRLQILGLLCTLLCLQGCNVKKFIPEGELLYTKGSVEIKNPSEVPDINDIHRELEGVLRPDPNSKILGMRLGLLVHYKAQREKPGFINKWLNKKIGEEPVYASHVDMPEVEEILLNRLENRGFFYSQVTSLMQEKPKKKEAEAIYTVTLAEPYLLEEYLLERDSLQVYHEIAENWEQTVITPEMRFDLPALKIERDRIDRDLKASGYYNFNPQFLIFEADTNQYQDRKFDLFLLLKKDVPEKAIIPYKIERVNIFPNYVIESDTVQRDTVRFENKNFIQNEVFFKPKKLDPFILLDEGDLYNPEKSGITSRRLTSIGTYQFVNIRYDEIDSLATDSLGYLEANIFLSPMNKRAIRAELQAVTKSNNFAGPHLALTYTNRNLFRGGEILSLSGRVGYEQQLSKGDNAGKQSIILGVDADVVFPRMLFPVIEIKSNWFEYSIPKTKIGAGFEYLNRSQLFSLFSVNGSFGYLWKANRFITHELNPFSVDYSQLSKTTPEFDKILKENPFLKSSFEQQFIAGLTYSFLYNEMIDALDEHQFFINANLDLAGNILDLLSNGETPKKFLGLEFAQYTRIDTDVRYHFNFAPEQTLATRIYAGIGIPYGNSDVMPYSRQFYAGGPYSIRAFPIRSLGPGRYTIEGEEEIPYYDRTGNLRLEANVEYRFPIYQFLKGAVFADAGNVWNTKRRNLPPEDELTPQQKRLIETGTFGSSFIDEFAIGVGPGLRIDIQSFVIRFDLGFPVHTPWYEKGERWQFRFGDPQFNFAIGYPF